MKALNDLLFLSDRGVSCMFPVASEMSETEYDIMQHQEDNLILPGVRDMHEGTLRILYDVAGKERLSSAFLKLDAGQQLQLIQNLAAKITAIREKKALNLLKIVVDPAWIFFDAVRGSVKFLYVPAKTDLYADEQEFETELRKGLLALIENANENQADFSLIILAEELADPALDLEYFKNYTRRKSLQLKPRSALLMEPMEIIKTPFLIGRKAQCVDGVINGSKLVGRIHCRIEKDSDGYILIDLESTNGTKLNGVRLESNQEYPIHSGDIISIANVDFEVHAN